MPGRGDSQDRNRRRSDRDPRDDSPRRGHDRDRDDDRDQGRRRDDNPDDRARDRKRDRDDNHGLSDSRVDRRGNSNNTTKQVRLGTPEQINGNFIQRRLNFSSDTQFLDPDINPDLPEVYKNVLNRAKLLNIDIEIVEAELTAGRASYTFKDGKATINIRKRNPQNAGNVLAEEIETNGLTIAIAHEMQHAIDDLAEFSEFKGKIRGSDSNILGREVPSSEWYPKIMSELHAHAVQAAVARELLLAKGKIPRSDELLTSFEINDFTIGKIMHAKLLEYFTLYGVSGNHDQKLGELLFLNYETIKLIIERGLNAPEKMGLPNKNSVVNQTPDEEGEIETIELD